MGEEGLKDIEIEVIKPKMCFQYLPPSPLSLQQSVLPEESPIYL